MRRGDEVLAIGATCTHYGGPLAEGLVVGDTVRCPWHHACFDLRTGAPVRAPALNPIPCYDVALADGRIRVGARTRRAGVDAARAARRCAPIVIVGAGAAGESRAPRRCAARATTGAILLFGADEAPPGRPPEPVEGLPRRQRARGVDPAAAARVLRRAEDRPRRSGARVDRASIPAAHKLTLADGRERRLGRAAARDRRRAGPARRCRAPTCRTSTRCARSPTAARSSQRADARPPRGGHRRELHRPGGGGVAARARARGARGRARGGAARADARRPSWARSCAASTRSTASRFHLGPDGHRVEPRRGRRSTGGDDALTADLVVHGRRRAAGARAGRGGRAARSTAASSSTTPAHQRARRLRRRRHRALPVRADGRARCASSTGSVAQRMGRRRRAQHAGRRAAVHGAAVLLDHALRRHARRTSATPRAGTASTSTAIWRRATRPSPTGAAGRRWRSRRSAATRPAWRPRSRSRRRPGDAGGVRPHAVGGVRCVAARRDAESSVWLAIAAVVVAAATGVRGRVAAAGSRGVLDRGQGALARGSIPT